VGWVNVSRAALFLGTYDVIMDVTGQKDKEFSGMNGIHPAPYER
jgi:hypothetical protein